MAGGEAAHGALDLQHHPNSLPVRLPSKPTAVAVQRLCWRSSGSQSKSIPGLSTVRAQP